ncbi:MAG: hypothetical protein ACHQ5A_10405 [Opitutales bacterium]
MFKRLLTVATVFALTLSTGRICAAAEQNFWPFWVRETDAAGNVQSWQAIGPLFFGARSADRTGYQGFRPLYLQQLDPRGTAIEHTLLYPVYTQRQDTEVFSWTVLNLINYSGPTNPAPGPDAAPKGFDLWPVYFSRDTGDPATSYHAVFPVAGTIKSRFGYDRLQWMLFPLYWQSQQGPVTTTSTPWPIIKSTAGGGVHGFTFWPLFSREEKPDVYRRQYYLWPLIYKYESQLDSAQPHVTEGFLPFYAQESRAGLVSRDIVWPFFGYSVQQTPVRYREYRYFWPLFVRGRGDEINVDRWAPFYTHSIRKGTEKTWVMWPLVRQEQWTADGLVQTKRQLFYFLYWSMEQRSAINPNLPAAEKTHLWPIMSTWNNGAGRIQVQMPSPLEVFFTDNNEVRQLYSPLFALFRVDQRAPDDVRLSLLWNAITWHRTPAAREFHFGPLFSTYRNAATESECIALGNGLIGLRRTAGAKGWHLFLFDFSPQTDSVVPSPTR